MVTHCKKAEKNSYTSCSNGQFQLKRCTVCKITNFSDMKKKFASARIRTPDLYIISEVPGSIPTRATFFFMSEKLLIFPTVHYCTYFTQCYWMGDWNKRNNILLGLKVKGTRNSFNATVDTFKIISGTCSTNCQKKQ